MRTRTQFPSIRTAFVRRVTSDADRRVVGLESNKRLSNPPSPTDHIFDRMPDLEAIPIGGVGTDQNGRDAIVGEKSSQISG